MNEDRSYATHKHTQTVESLFLRVYGTNEKHKGLSVKEPYVLWSLVPINILINRKPEHNHESSRGRRKKESAQKKKKRERSTKSQATETMKQSNSSENGKGRAMTPMWLQRIYRHGYMHRF